MVTIAGVRPQVLAIAFASVVTVLRGQVMLRRELVGLMKSIESPSTEMFKRGREMGYEAGWREGHRAARPVLVKMTEASNRGSHSAAGE